MNDSNSSKDTPDDKKTREEWLEDILDASWKHLGSGDFTSGPTSSYVDIYFRRESDKTYTLRFFGEALESDEPPLELEEESYEDVSELISSLVERGFIIDMTDLKGSTSS